MVLFFIAQLSSSYGVRVDLDRFFSAFSMLVGENRVQIVPWTQAPGHRRREALENTSDRNLIDNAEYVDQQATRKRIHERWVDYELYTAGHIPWAVCTNKFPALIEETREHDEADNNGALIHFLVRGYVTLNGLHSRPI